jgi:hypothetical protein
MVYPVRVLTQKGDGLALEANRAEFELLAQSGSLLARGTHRRVRRVWLLRPVDEAYDWASARARQISETREPLPLEVLMRMVTARKHTYREKLLVQVGGERVYTGLWCWSLKRART